MNFIRRDDKDLLDDLVENQVFSLADFARLKTPETGHLLHALMDNHTEIRANEWIYWMVRRHGCIRLASVRVPREWIEEQKFSPSLIREMRDASLFPFARQDEGWLVAAGRPFDRALWEKKLNGDVTAVAATLTELRMFYSCYPETY